MSDQHTQAYQDALVDAQAELREIQSHFDQLARRKTYLAQFVDAIAPLLGHAEPASLQAQQQSQFAQAQSHQVPSHADQQFVPVLQQAASTLQEPAPLPARTAEPLIGHEPEKHDDIFANFAATSEPAQAEQQAALQQNETKEPAPQPASGDPASGDIDQRIKYALNFALLS